MTLRAITLTQPWCGLMAAGIKRVENRSRPLIKRSAIGTDIAFHASREIDNDVYRRIREIDPTCVIALDACTTSRWYDLSRITSAITHVAKLVDIVEGLVNSDAHRRIAFEQAVTRGTVTIDQTRWYFGRHGYVFADERILREPVPVRGWQGCWTVDDATAAKVMEQLR